MPYVFSMTSRMVSIAVSCALLLCVLLFLLGFEIGARFVVPAPQAPATSAVSSGALVQTPSSAGSDSAPVASSASSTPSTN
ncbi:hypothetical protein M0D69_13420 [Caballeronia sp. SEWSISQ10-4 2]|uniref:hypothetical protein n=1 Tax=Caballeronia sp. SEWSISQ10-4 2 TaxID=2937438 RepID=UPI002653FA5B|nr:hypothetical protein [Caballeronia sp. SEWSISQ10-4 2]MDN7178996.1 hypothetical protein [Caballeronia sp. SEWSISQ10-4 2]